MQRIRRKLEGRASSDFTICSAMLLTTYLIEERLLGSEVGTPLS